MALNIRDAETNQLAERLASLVGEAKAAAVAQALRERAARDTACPHLADRLDEIHPASWPSCNTSWSGGCSTRPLPANDAFPQPPM